ncbi:DNA-binding transcriptional LysR family regulator [Actinoplanes teichomyceticus]|uniref:DNA-binding transcriptional LysR family regulator n=2 Tax=Actinoplanes teichomyceticus TaxID=1867 RepID=A0A561VMF4_ACTTI|nr:DNA-binding transcriptional LysR family regulator [Actinoplanes teichomyceticus]GIF13534.1 putative transcriptional regulator, LysR family protein [Actinoplanes teichomyceticus]
MTVELRHLRAFLAIADEGTITRAAARLHVTQPALSRTLRQLETHLGVRLIDRSTHHLQLTAAGHAFQPRAAAAVAAVDEALDPAGAGTWPLRVGHAWSALGEHTTPLLRRWKQEHPHTPVQLLRVDDRTAGLAHGTVDVAVIRGRADLPDEVHTVALLTEPRLAAVAADSVLTRKPRLTLHDLSTEPIAVNTVAGTTTPDLWPADEIPTDIIEVANTDDWLAAITTGHAVGVTTTATAAMYPHPAVVYIPLIDAPAVTVYLVWRQPPSHPAVPDLITLAQRLITPPPLRLSPGRPVLQSPRAV